MKSLLSRDAQANKQRNKVGAVDPPLLVGEACQKQVWTAITILIFKGRTQS